MPEDVVRRRYRSGLRNFFRLYRPLASGWRIYDNSGGNPVPIATGEGAIEKQVLDAQTWTAIKQEYLNG